MDPRKLMGYLGLVPSEHSSGERVSRGSITKIGNTHARRLLTEAAWNYRFKAHRRSRAASPGGLAAADSRHRLETPIAAHGTFCPASRLHARGLQINKVCVAVARELAGFVWAIARARAGLPVTD